LFARLELQLQAGELCKADEHFTLFYTKTYDRLLILIYIYESEGE
jgi:hypothetical protein